MSKFTSAADLESKLENLVTPALCNTTAAHSIGINNSKIDIKVSAEGVAKLTFNFLEELHGDSSLEPGEVKTPPNSPIVRAVVTQERPLPKPKAPVAILSRKEIVPKFTKSASQLDAEVCQEKVRAILELDAIKRKEEAEKRKEEMETRRRSGEGEVDKEKKKKAKEERKRLKRLKREQESARLALLSDEEEEVKQKNEANGDKPQTILSKGDDDESEGLYSSSDSTSRPSDQLRNLLANSTALPPTGPCYSLQPHMASYKVQDSFMDFRGMNPFIRGPRPDFHNSRGGFIPRGRSCMRGGMRFPTFRSQFYANGPPRHHGPPTIQRTHTTPPPRGHSPIKAPDSKLIWTKTKPSISYAFRSEQDWQKLPIQTQNTEEVSAASDEKSNKIKSKSRLSSNKQRKKSKKSSDREKVKKRRSSRTSSEKSCKRKIEKIRNSMNRPMDKSKITLETLKANEEQKKLKKAIKAQSENQQGEEQLNNCAIDAKEIQIVLEKIKIEKVDGFKETTPPFELMKDAAKAEVKGKDTNTSKIKSEAKTDNNTVGATDTEICTEICNDAEMSEETSKNLEERGLDMFAESPPRQQKPSVSDIQNMLQAARKASGKEDTPKSTHKRNSRDSSQDNKRKELSRDKDKSASKPMNSVTGASSKKETDQERGTTPPLPQTKQPSEKTSLQKAIEIQKRIDKLLQEDDLQVENIQATKEKLLAKTKKLAKESKESKKSNISKDTKEIVHSPAPEPPKHRNPFKRSISRDRYFGRLDTKRRSRSKSRERDTISSKNVASKDRSRRPVDKGNRAQSRGRHSGGSAGSLNRSRSGDQDWRSSTGSLNSSRSKDEERSQRGASKSRDIKRKKSRSPLQQDDSSKRKSQSLQQKLNKIDTSPRSQKSIISGAVEKRKNEMDKGKAKIKAVKKSFIQKQKTVPLCFTAAEFLFPEEGSDKDIDDGAKTPPKPASKSWFDHSSTKRNTAVAARNKDASPDTDDYMDNWENDENELEGNSNAGCGSSTPKISVKHEVDNFVPRFANPSPPMQLLKDKGSAAGEEGSSTPQSSPPLPTKMIGEIQHELNLMEELTTKELAATKNLAATKELFGMQEIYDQFIKSVEQSGVDIKSKSMASNSTMEVLALERTDEHLSASTTSNSSSSSSSSSSEASNSSSSSSSSSTASSSEESNDTDSFQEHKESSPKTAANNKIATTAVEKESIGTKTLSTAQQSGASPGTPPLAAQSATVTTEAIPKTLLTPPPAADGAGTPPITPLKTPKSDATRDFKKLRSLEANLARIQMMRATYDSADEISEELIKMEKLFLQEKNLILLKYSKPYESQCNRAEADMSPATSATAVEKSTNAIDITVTPSGGVSGQFVQSMQVTASESAATSVTDRIFDSNREAIKLTISPLKLPKTPAIFEKDNDIDTSSKCSAEPDEADFTEKLLKPTKEIAIVKPMMESKESRSSYQRHRRSPPSSAGSASSRSTHEHTRSPSNASAAHRDRDRGKRSASRSRSSPHRRGRARSLSASPPRRGIGNTRHISPQRRGTYSVRYRTSGRRSRSRSRSISRQSSRRGGELSPATRRRRNTGTATGRKGVPGRALRDSRSRSPQLHAHSPRPHSPRSPLSAPSKRHRSYSRERYSRSPLPFKPPSPPMRRSISPLDATRRRSRSRSPLPRMPRSPRSPRASPPSRYEDRRRRRDNSYDRRSASPQSHQYYAQDTAGVAPGVPSSTSSYYYNVSPNRISLDARINIVLNGPHSNQDGTAVSYDSYSNYGHYGGAAYMSVPPHPVATDSSVNPYYANQYVHMSSSGSAQHMHSHQQVYSNIPTISGSGGSTTSSNYYYGEFGSHHGSNTGLGAAAHQHQSTSLLKELPKATVAVQKGNVLEIVPSSELPEAPTAIAKAADAPIKLPKKKEVKVSWKEEVNQRQLRVEVLKLSRESDNSSRSILKKTETAAEMPKEDSQFGRKKVYFEDGIFPNRDSDTEDRREIESKMRRKLRRLRKQHGKAVTIPAGILVTGRQPDEAEKENKVDVALVKVLPPPPPPGMPPPHLEQPIYRRPLTPTPPLYFHFDSIVHSMYISQLERPIPPRLLSQKCLSSGGGGSSQSPLSHAQSPISGGLHGSSASSSATTKKDLTALAALNHRSSRSNEHNSHSSPKLMQQQLQQQQQRRDNPAATFHMSMLHSEHPHPVSMSPSSHGAVGPPPMGRGAFQTIQGAPPVSVSSQIAPPHLSAVTLPRQTTPIGFVGMRLNNMMRLPPSPLTRGMHPIGPPNFAPPQQNAIPVVGLRHNHHQPPPPHTYHMLPPPPTNEYAVQNQQQHYAYTCAPPPSHHQHFHAPPQHRPPPQPGFYMPPPSPVRNVSPLVECSPMSSSAAPPQAVVTTTSKEDSAALQGNPQAMVAPFTVRRS